jgi:protein-L-isoaspartate(D-aspartate) O-methyltransferase
MTELVENLKSSGVFWSDRVQKAMVAVDRKHFLQFADFAYVDTPQRMGETTASAPHLHAACLQVLEPKLVSGSKVLDIGCGCGYLSAGLSLPQPFMPSDNRFMLLSNLVAAYMVAPQGRVFGVEVSQRLLELSQQNCATAVPDAASICVWEPAGSVFGLEAQAPFDAIHVGAGCDTVPEGLVAQLAEGGRMVIPVNHQLLQVDKKNGEVVTTVIYSGVQFTPLHTL